MQTTSHFIGIAIDSKLLSDIFVEVHKYLKENNILDAVNIQNPISPHITLYYLEKDLSHQEKINIKKNISLFNISDEIFLTGINYFFRGENRFVLYFTTNTKISLKSYRDTLHEKYNRIDVEDNSFDFFPHITFLRVLNPKVFEIHRKNIENIINREIEKIKSINISDKKICLYAVNSTFREEIQIVI